jgi:hypothetical protein
MARITELDVGKALEKLRGPDALRSRMTQLDEKNDALDKELRSLRAANRRLERDQQAGGDAKRD